nr:site-specific integrase [Eilatimonas milleporae]
MGKDPIAEAKRKDLERRLRENSTFNALADELLKRQEEDENLSPKTITRDKSLLEKARPSLGWRPISEITAMEINDVLQGVVKRGTVDSAYRLRALISRIFRLAIVTGRAETNPADALKEALPSRQSTPRPAITDPEKLGGLLRAIDSFDGQIWIQAAMQLLPMLFQRPGELRQAKWENFDLENRIWTIPDEVMKMRRPHMLPLPSQAVDILNEIRVFTGHSDYAFPSVKSIERPISDGTLNSVLKRLGYTPDEVVPHGFRATASTLLNESGLFNPDAIERQLAHLDRNKVRGVYNRSQYWDERVKMTQWWADYLDKLKKDAGHDPRMGKPSTATSLKSMGAPDWLRKTVREQNASL